MRLANAHVELLKAELAVTAQELGLIVGLAIVALLLAFLLVCLVYVGTFLFLGEWLFGSIGWGVLLGTLLLVDVAVVLVLLALDVKAGRLGSSFILALVAGLGVGVVLALNLTYRGWTALGDAVASAYDPSTRTMLLAIGALAAIGAILGLLSRMRGGVGEAIGGVVMGALIGALLGGLTVIQIPAQAGAATGVLVTLIAWPILAAREVMQTGIDGEAIMKKFTPDETIGMTKETIEWVRARMPLAPKS